MSGTVQTFADFNTAARLKEAMAKIARKVFSELYQTPRHAMVVSVNHTTREYELVFPGEIETFIVIHNGAVVPADTSATVRVAGPAGNRYIEEVFGPALFMGDLG